MARGSAGDSSDKQLAHALSDMTESLDDAMERSIAATNPADAGAFGAARRAYRNMLPLERGITTAGEAAAHGIITPQALSNAVVYSNAWAPRIVPWARRPC